MPRSVRQMKVYHMQICKRYILKALDRLEKIGLNRNEWDGRIKEAGVALIDGLNVAYASSLRLLQLMSEKPEGDGK